MNIFKWSFIKVLKNTRLIKYFNFTLLKTINEVKVKIPFINGMGISNFFINTDWLDSLILLFAVDEEDTFVDIGVNIGQTLIRVKTLRPGINYMGFEPNSSCNSYVRQLINANYFQKCTIHNNALSSEIRILVLEKTLIDDLRASVISSLRPGYFIHKENVIAIDYDLFFYHQKISFVKIDVEGAELDVINGMKQSIITYQPLIVCEVLDSHHPLVFDFTQSRATELSSLLSILKYSIIRLVTSGEKHKIVSYEKIDKIQIKQWTKSSLNLNDYLFYPTTKEQVVDTVLKKICN